MENAEIISVKWADASGINANYIHAVEAILLIDGAVTTHFAYKRNIPDDCEWVIGDVILPSDHPLHKKLVENVSCLPTLDTSNIYFVGWIVEYGRRIETYAGAVFFAAPVELHYTGYCWWIQHAVNCRTNAVGEEVIAATLTRDAIILFGQTACERYCRDRVIVLGIVADLMPIIHEYLMALLLPAGQPAILEPTHFVFGSVNE